MSNPKRRDSNFTVTILSSLIVGIVLTIIGCLFSNNLAILFGASVISLIPASDYIFGFMLSSVANIFNFVLINYSIDAYPNICLYAAMIITVSSVILDLIFVLIFNLGMFGMGLSTSIANIVTFIFINSFHV